MFLRFKEKSDFIIYSFQNIQNSWFNNFRVFERETRGKGVIKMEVKNGLRDRLYSIEGEELKQQHLLAFQDFCLDLFEEEYGKVPPEEKIDPRFVKGLVIRS